MGMRVTGITETSVRLNNVSKKTNAAGLAAMRQGAKDIVELAQKMAPVDKHNLEAAIEAREDRLGINSRVRITVFVNESRAVPGREGKTVGDYARRMHEGFYKLGKGSQAKQAGQPGIRVGRKYLTRALEELESDIARSVEAAVRRAL